MNGERETVWAIFARAEGPTSHRCVYAIFVLVVDYAYAVGRGLGLAGFRARSHDPLRASDKKSLTLHIARGI